MTRAKSTVRPTQGQRAARRARGCAALVVALGLLGVATSAPAVTPSPADWRDVVIYQVVTDRFSDGNASNNALEGNFAPAEGFRIHGGDFAGLLAKLDYLQQLGVDAVWISPVVVNANAEYHGYAARNLYAIAPHFGTLAELQSLSDALHARGMRLILDVVLNHMGDLIDSADPDYPTYDPAGYPLRWRNNSKHYFGVLDNLARFHNHGEIGNFVDPEQILGELSGLDDLKTEDPVVQAELENASRWLIANTDCDGYRIDTVKHVEMGFWNVWSPAVHANADSLGKSAFFLFGEAFDGDDAKVGSYTGTQSGGNYKLDSMLHYPMYYTALDVFAFDQPPAWISGRYGLLSNYDPTSRERLVTFLDNHDNPRFLSFQVGNQDESRLRAALGWLLTARGVPTIYYGTEQEFDGGGDPYDREDMWDGQWDFGPSDGDNFDLTHPLFRYTQRLLRLRHRHEALRRGATLERYVEGSGPGLYAYQRATAAETVVVVVNTSNLPLVRNVSSPWPAGTALAIEEPGVEAILAATTTAGGIPVRLPARGVQIVSRNTSADSMLDVLAMSPGHDQAVNDRWQPLALRFDQPVNSAALAAAFQIQPATPGQWVVLGTLARFFPNAPWTAGLQYRWGLAEALGSASGAAMPARFDATFRTTAYATGITVPAGYAVDRIASQGLGAPEGLALAPVSRPDALLIGDTNKDQLFTLTPGGDLGPYLGDARWARPEGVALAPDGSVTVIDPNGVFAVDSTRMTTVTIGGSSASLTGAGAWGPPAFGARLYLGDPAGDRVAWIVAGNVLQTFATGIGGAEGLAFGPGGAWGSDLYVADANLTSLGTAANGTGRIVRVTVAGAVSTFVQDPALLNGACALAFDGAGRFGGDLFVADILGDRILRVTPAGAVSVFASGFRNLSGSQCLAFGPDGALYVADPGSGQPFSNVNGVNPPQVWRIAPLAVPTDAPRGAEPFEASFDPPTPNPSRDAVTLAFTTAHDGPVTLAIYDLAGRRLRTLLHGERVAGPQHVRWDGRDAAGVPTPAGLYFARLELGRRTLTRRIALTR